MGKRKVWTAKEIDRVMDALNRVEGAERLGIATDVVDGVMGQIGSEDRVVMEEFMGRARDFRQIGEKSAKDLLLKVSLFLCKHAPREADTMKKGPEGVVTEGNAVV